MNDWKIKVKECIETSFPIVNKQADEVPFILNKAQLKFLDNMTGRDIILKARQEGFCLEPSTKILTARLEWKKIKDLSVGEKLVSTDEENGGSRGRGRKLRTSIIEAKREIMSKALRLTMDDGRVLVATPDHRFLTKRKSTASIKFRKIKLLKVGDAIRYVTTPWSSSTKEDYWMGGLIDGEAHLRQKKSGGVELCLSQVNGPVYGRIIKYIKDHAFKCRLDWDVRKTGEKSKLGNKPVGRIIFSRISEMFKLIGKTRPTKGIGWEWWNGMDLPGKRNGLAWSKIIKIEKLKKRRMIDLQTSTKTFIAEGFVSHNSSLILALFTYDFLFKPNSVSVSLSYEAGAAEKLLDKVKLYIKNLGVPMKYNSRNEMANEAIGSTFYIGTAAALNTGRGQTITNLHASEVAFYKDGYKLMTGLLQSVPRSGKIILESTANGMGDYFHKEWNRGIAGDGAFTPHFFSWKDHDEYQIPVDNTFKPTQEETTEMIEYGLSKEQINWKREKIKQFKTIDEFNQEYPITPEVAFISSGNPVFDIKVLNRMSKMTTEPKYKGNLIGTKRLLTLDPNPKGYLSVWELPNSSDEYVIGADVGTSNDYSVAEVISRRKMEVVARFRAKLPVDAFAKELERLSYFYNTALLGVERNNQGIAVLVVLNSLYYPNLFYKEDTNDVGESSVSKLGWITDVRSRPVMISDLGMYIRNNEIQIHDQVTINELMTFVRTDNKPDGEAQSGCWDDCVMALAIAVQMYRRFADNNRRDGYVTHSADSNISNNFDTPSTAFANF